MRAPGMYRALLWCYPSAFRQEYGGEMLQLFAEQRIYMVSQAANDLNITFLVDQDQGDRLVEQLHELLVSPVPEDASLGPSWSELFGHKQVAAPVKTPSWWAGARHPHTAGT